MLSIKHRPSVALCRGASSGQVRASQPSNRNPSARFPFDSLPSSNSGADEGGLFTPRSVKNVGETWFVEQRAPREALSSHSNLFSCRLTSERASGFLRQWQIRQGILVLSLSAQPPPPSSAQIIRMLSAADGLISFPIRRVRGSPCCPTPPEFQLVSSDLSPRMN